MAFSITSDRAYLSIKKGDLQKCDVRLPRGEGPRLCQIPGRLPTLGLGSPAPGVLRVLMAFLLCLPRLRFVLLFNAF